MGLLNQAMELQNLPMAEEVVEGVVVTAAVVVVGEVEDTEVAVVVVEVLEEEEVEVVERRPAPQCLNLSQVLSRRLVLRPNVPLSQTGFTSTCLPNFLIHWSSKHSQYATLKAVQNGVPDGLCKPTGDSVLSWLCHQVQTAIQNSLQVG